jgi:hypothetical protein
MGKKGMNPVVFNVPNSIVIFPILEFTILFDGIYNHDYFE